MWNEEFKKLVSWIKKNNKTPKINSHDITETHLALFYQEQKRRFRKIDVLKDQIEMLRPDSFIIAMNKRRDNFKKWLKHFKKAEEFKKTYGKLPTRKVKIGKELGLWCENQRRRLRNENTILSFIQKDCLKRLFSLK